VAQAERAVYDVQVPDFMNVAEQLTDDERQIHAAVARFIDERVLPIISDCFEHERFPRELVSEIAGMGLLGATLPAAYDCAELSNVAYGLIMQELERGDSGIRSFASVQSGLCMWPIHEYGREEQKRRWLPAMARGQKIGCFGLTEPDGGSDPGAMKTHARRSGGDWVLNGAKMWITNGSIADLAIVWAKTDAGVRGFVVEKDTPGYTTRDIKRKMSLRASITSELFFDNVRVPEANRLPGAEGLGAPLSCLTQARYGIAWGAVGAAQACYQEALNFCRQRVLFGSPLIHKQIIQQRLANMLRQITLGQLLVLRLGRLKDAGTMHHSQASLAKWNNLRMALDVAREARDLLGAGGITVEHCPVRHMLNLESVITYEGTETIHQLIVGREIAGVSAF
jgi:glutaryl-CoA dehydrogenase